jgi:hypothetical protein
MAEESYTILGELKRIADNLHEGVQVRVTYEFPPEVKELLAQIVAQLHILGERQGGGDSTEC